jgi:PhnB protein
LDNQNYIQMAKSKPLPEGYHSVMVYLSTKDAVKAVEFYKKAFGAKEVGRITMPHARGNNWPQ